jgi:hypothetical protein
MIFVKLVFMFSFAYLVQLSQGQLNSFCVTRKINSTLYRLDTDDAIIQYLLSQDTQCELNESKFIDTYQFTLKLGIYLERDFNKRISVDAKRADDLFYKRIVNAYFTDELIKHLNLREALDDAYYTFVKRFSNTTLFDCEIQLFIPFKLKDKNIDRINKRISSLLDMVLDLINKRSYTLFQISKNSIISKAELENRKIINAEQNELFCTNSAGQDQADVIPFSSTQFDVDYKDFINLNLITTTNSTVYDPNDVKTSNASYIVRLNSYNYLQSGNLNLDSNSRYQYRLEFDLKLKNQLFIRLCYKPLVIDDYIFYDNNKQMQCDSDDTDLYLINNLFNDFNMTNTTLSFQRTINSTLTPFEVKFANGRSIGTSLYLVCLNKTDSFLYDDYLLSFNKFFNASGNSSSTSSKNSSTSLSSKFVLINFLIVNLGLIGDWIVKMFKWL